MTKYKKEEMQQRNLRNKLINNFLFFTGRRKLPVKDRSFVPGTGDIGLLHATVESIPVKSRKNKCRGRQTQCCCKWILICLDDNSELKENEGEEVYSLSNVWQKREDSHSVFVLIICLCSAVEVLL